MLTSTVDFHACTRIPGLNQLLSGIRHLPEVANDGTETLAQPVLKVEGDYSGPLDDIDNETVNKSLARLLFQASGALQGLDHERFQVQGMSFYFDPDKSGRMQVIFDLYDAHQ